MLITVAVAQPLMTMEFCFICEVGSIGCISVVHWSMKKAPSQENSARCGVVLFCYPIGCHSEQIMLEVFIVLQMKERSLNVVYVSADLITLSFL